MASAVPLSPPSSAASSAPASRTSGTRTHPRLARSLSDGSALYPTSTTTGTTSRSPPSGSSTSTARGAKTPRANGLPSYRTHDRHPPSAYDAHPISSAASSSSRSSDNDSIASTYPSTVASDAPAPSREKRRRLFRSRVTIAADAPPLEPVSDINAKLGRHKTYALRDYLTSRRKEKGKGKGKGREAPFPPAHWFDGSESGRSEYATALEGAVTSASASASEVGAGTRSAPATLPDQVHVEEGAGEEEADGEKTPTGERTASEPGHGAEDEEQDHGPGPEPITLARRIQSLLAAIPTSLPTSSAPPEPQASSPAAPLPPPTSPVQQDGSADGAPPVRALTDYRLMSMLSDTSIMNGSLEKGRQSVFAILDRLKLPSRSHAAVTAATATADSTAANDVDAGYESDDGSSIMLYGPLVPDEESEAEIARSDVMSVTDDGEMWEYERPARRLSRLGEWEGSGAASPSAPGPEPIEERAEERKAEESKEEQGHGKEGSAAWRWLESWKTSGKDAEASGSTAGSEATATPAPAPAPVKHVKTKVVWVPSPDKISFQATWWGYRLYLPPPVLDVLNNKRLEAAKRAAIITTALKWLLDSVPVAIVPPQFRAGLMIAQRLVPYLGYVGGFMAWSWGAIKSFDKGYGVVLTATWLLPVALIPGTWEVSDFGPPGDNASEAGTEGPAAGPSRIDTRS